MPELLESDAAGLYALEDTVHGPRLGFGTWAGLQSERVNKLLAAGLEQFGQFAAYDALRPSAGQRNRLVCLPSTRRIAEMKEMNVRALNVSERREAIARVQQHNEMFKRLGVENLQHQRLLLCDGPRLLAWVGVLDSRECPPQRRKLLCELAAMLRPRLRLERERGHAGLAFAALDASLEAIGAPAFVVDHRGTIVHTNHVGQTIIDHGHHRIGDLLARAQKGSGEGTDSYDLASRGQPGARLIVLRSESELAATRKAAVVSAWSLTPRETEVLERVVAGDTNRDIATTLACAEATVEIHMSRLLRKAGVLTRTALVSAYWNAGCPLR